uniref:Uncharacterized protein n=1 Tax=Anguilla anguilla TaxID=7936 RepID=A0A0E9TIE0_ANGAN
MWSSLISRATYFILFFCVLISVNVVKKQPLYSF